MSGLEAVAAAAASASKPRFLLAPILPRVTEAAGSRRKESTTRAVRGFLTSSMSPSNLEKVLLPLNGVIETFVCEPEMECLCLVLRSSGEDGSRSTRSEVPIFVLMRHGEGVWIDGSLSLTLGDKRIATPTQSRER